MGFPQTTSIQCDECKRSVAQNGDLSGPVWQFTSQSVAARKAVELGFYVDARHCVCPDCRIDWEITLGRLPDNLVGELERQFSVAMNAETWELQRLEELVYKYLLAWPDSLSFSVWRTKDPVTRGVGKPPPHSVSEHYILTPHNRAEFIRLFEAREAENEK